MATKSINEVWYRVFKGKIKFSNCKIPLKFLKSVDPMLFPPCKKVLHLHIKRAWYICKLYRSASDAYPCINEEPNIPILSSCKNFLEIHWFHGDEVP